MLDSQHIVSTYFPKIYRTPLLGKTLTYCLRTLFHESEYAQFIKDYPQLTGIDFVEKILEYFNFTYTVRDSEFNNIPDQGRVIIYANHPIGTLDGMALLKLVSHKRKDIKIVANQVLSSVEPLEKLLLPVNNLQGSTLRENIQNIEDHLESDGAVIFFPAGSVSRISPRGVRDGRWSSGFLRMANKTQSPLLPVYVNAKNSWFFYVLSMFAKPLSTLWLVREMFKHTNNVAHMRVGRPITFEQYNKVHLDIAAKVSLLKKQLYRLDKSKPLYFETETTIAPVEERKHLIQDLSKGKLLAQTPDQLDIYLCDYQADSCLMREIGRLREFTFRTVGEGTGERRDIDRFDENYQHLILWDSKNLEIAGAYRLGNVKNILEKKGLEGIYTQTLFEYSENAQELLNNGLELGRSFVQPKYWGKRSLDYLWYGIGAYLRDNPQYKYLFGPVSLSNTYPKHAKDLLVYFYTHYFSQKTNIASANNPYRLDLNATEVAKSIFKGDDAKSDFKILKRQLSFMQVKVPTLYKQYTELTEEGGAKFLDFNIDQDFADCIDGLVIVEINKIKPKKHQRYIGSNLQDSESK